MHDAFERFNDRIEAAEGECEDPSEECNFKVVILYLGDHDPSGMDMVRDIKDRLKDFFKGYRADLDGYDIDDEGFQWEFEEWFEKRFEIVRIGLNMEQIRRFNPPPNPAKITDPRAGEYIKKYGPASWKVDALNPKTLHELVEEGILTSIDTDKYTAIMQTEKVQRNKLKSFVKQLKADE